MDEQFFDYRFYSYIYQDQELKALFEQLTEFYNNEIKRLNDQAEQQIKAIYPDFAPIKKQIQKLEEVGIVVKDYDKWFDVDEYNWDIRDFNVDIFCNAKFNGFTLTQNEVEEIKDFHYLINADVRIDLIPGGQAIIDQDYFKKSLKQTLKNEKYLRKELKKAEKPIKLYNVNEPTATKYFTDIDKIKKINEELERNKLDEEKFEFLMDLSYAQRSVLLKTCYEVIYNYKETCLDFLEKKLDIRRKCEEAGANITKEANGLSLRCELVQNNIKLKVLKRLIEFLLIDIENVNDEDVSRETILLIDYFIKTHEEDFIKWYYAFKSQFNCFLQGTSKTQKLDYRRSIWD